MAPFYAHSFGDDRACWELLEVHLQEVAELAAEFASTFGAAEWGRLAGLWHDLGKYQEKFQRRILGERIQVPHAGVGAAFACSLHASDGLPLAFAIAGHHTGLSNLQVSGNGPTALKQTLQDNSDALAQMLAGDVPACVSGKLPDLRHRIAGLRCRPVLGQRALLLLNNRLLLLATWAVGRDLGNIHGPRIVVESSGIHQQQFLAR